MPPSTFFSEQRLTEIERKIEALQRDKRRKITDPYFIFLDNAEFKQLLGISDNTATAWRQQGRVRYSTVGRLIFYRLHDISEMIRESEVGRPKSEEKRESEVRSPKSEVEDLRKSARKSARSAGKKSAKSARSAGKNSPGNQRNQRDLRETKPRELKPNP